MLRGQEKRVRDAEGEMSWKKLAVCWVMAAAVTTAGCEAFPFKQQEVRYQEVGIIRLKDRMVPAEVKLVKGVPARLHIIDGTGAEGEKLTISGLNMEVGVTPGTAASVTLAPKEVAKLDGQALSGAPGRGMVRFRVVGNEKNLMTEAMGGRAEVAVVLTGQLAAPKRVVLTRGVPVVMYVAMSESETGFDNFGCDALGLTTRVQDREVKEVEWRPESVGTYVFTGTVTPDSQVSVVVVEAGR